MRGTPSLVARVRVLIRIIPAHAGNSKTYRQSSRRSTDHPRACGELTARDYESLFADGSSPRMRGTLGCSTQSPRTRRIIPAHAGNSLSRPEPESTRSDHPRACGELIASALISGLTFGSSPRMRGTPQTIAPSHEQIRIIPAHAGNSRPVKVHRRTMTDHPRACGELGAIYWARLNRVGSSPRMRELFCIGKSFSSLPGSSPRMRGTHLSAG